MVKISSQKVEMPVSFMPPEYLTQALEAFKSRQITLAALQSFQDRAVEDLVERQLSEGCETVTDGTFRNVYGLSDFWLQFDGVESRIVLSGRVYQNQESGELVPAVVSKISFNPLHSVFAHYQFLVSLCGNPTAPRVDIPSPALFLLSILKEDWLAKGLYENMTDLAIDIATAYNLTLLKLGELGCRQVLLYDSSWAMLCDNEYQKRLMLSGIDLNTVMRKMLETNDAALAGLPDNMRRILYTPTKTPITDDCREVIATVFSHKNVTDFMVDNPLANAASLKMLKLFPQGKGLIVGLTSAKHPYREPADLLTMKERQLRHAAKPLALKVSTIGGFRTTSSTIDSSAFTTEDQWLKISLLSSV